MRVTGRQPGFGNVGSDDQFRLLRNLAEDLKVPLTQIIAQADNKNNVENTAVSATNLIDAYILCNKVMSGQQVLNIEPVSLKPLFDDVAHNLYLLARERGFTLENTRSRNSEVVLSDRRVLGHLFSSVIYSFLNTSAEDNVIKFLTKKGSSKVRAGIFTNAQKLKASDLNVIRELSGKASVLSANMHFGSSSGVAIADTLSSLLNTRLSVAKKSNQSGLEVMLTPSMQLSLI